MEADLPDLLTVTDAAARLKIHSETLRRAIRDGKIAHYRMQGCIRVSVEQLSDYLAANLHPIRAPVVRVDDVSPVAQFRVQQRFRRALAQGSR